jgi:hypothetical protein
MPPVHQNITRVLREAARTLTLVEITDLLNKVEQRSKPYTYDEVRGQLEQMDEVYESRGRYTLKG